MSILVQVECGEEYTTRSFSGRGRMVVDLPGQSLILKDFPTPGVVFKPPLTRECIFRGAAKSFSRSRVVDILDGEFSIRSEGLKIFGSVKTRELKEPDNYLVP